VPLALPDFLDTLGAQYRRDVALGLTRPLPAGVVTEADLAPLPPILQTFLRRAGVVGQPRVGRFRTRFEGEMRVGHGGRWMPVRAVQHTFLKPPARYFLLDATLFGLPLRVLHRMVGAAATMRVKVLSLFTVVDAKGPEMDQSEAVTFFNDLCLLAPGALLEVPVRWEQTGPATALGHYSHGGGTVTATLTFSPEGDLTGFTSGDRYQSADGRHFARYPWSTPAREHRLYGDLRLPSAGDAVWHEPDGEFLYARFRFTEIVPNPLP